jgi:predicted ArsR family transcriptional regulator
MSDKRKHEFMEKLDSCYKIVQQSSAKGKGISAVEIADQLGKHRTTVHSYLNSLEFMGKVYSEKGLWYAKEVKEDSIKEKEIELTIELPAEDEDEREYEARLKTLAEDKDYKLDFVKDYLKARKDARTIKIRGKNIDAIKEELPKMIMEALKEQNKRKPFWKRRIKLP